MNIKLKRVIEEIEKTEGKILEWQEYVKQLKQQRKQLEDLEIIKTIRSMQLTGGDMLKLLDDIQSGNISIISDLGDEVYLDQEEKKSGQTMQEDDVQLDDEQHDEDESEDLENEEINDETM